MRLLVDNLDGQGLVDYSERVLKRGPLQIVRRWNEPSACTALLYVDAPGAVPLRHGRVMVLGDDDSTLFTGFVMSASGDGDGALQMVAKSDEAIADDAGVRAAWSAMGDGLADAVQRAVAVQGAGLLSAPFVTDERSLGVWLEGDAAACSTNVGEMARAARCSYTAAGLMVSVSDVGGVVHSAAGVVKATWKADRAGANDICVSGEMEPAAYVTECFAGDGVTSSFELMDAPFQETARVLTDDSFADAALSDWLKKDTGGWTSVGGAGLLLGGGSGTHGVTYLQRAAGVEMGGALMAEAEAVQLSGACDGVLCGLYDGGMLPSNCVAGVRVRQSSGVTVAAALVNGVETGAAIAIAEGHRYTFRVRVFADAARRVKQVFRVGVGGSEAVFGGGTEACGGRVVVDVQDLRLSSSTAATVMCDASAAALPAVCTFAAVESAQMFGSVRRVVLRHESVEVRKRTAVGADVPVLVGVRGEGVDAWFASGGSLSFFDGRVPEPGEKVVVRYRTRSRAVGRCEDAVAIATADAMGVPGRVQWRGRIARPVARSSEDCENAAAALLALGTDDGAGRAGRCEMVRYGAAPDVWPGDVVQDERGPVVVREVAIRDEQTEPESARVEVRVANEWAEPLSLTTREGLATDVHGVVPVRSIEPLDDLRELEVIAVTETAIQIDAGMDAPSGGGFEVRRWDAGFGATVSGADADLVLRSPVRGFDIPRVAQQEMYAVRMYDGSSPRRYSRWSAVVRVTVPMA